MNIKLKIRIKIIFIMNIKITLLYTYAHLLVSLQYLISSVYGLGLFKNIFPFLFQT